VEYYHNNSSLPVYDYPVKGYSQEEIVDILCDLMLDKKLICTFNPVSVENSVAFVVDVSKLRDPNDVRADDLGAWRCSGSRVLNFFVKVSTNSCCLVASSSPGAVEIGIKRQYFIHMSDPDFHRMIAFLESLQSQGEFFVLL